MRCCLATWFTADFAEVGEACLSTLRRYGERHDIAVRANFRVTDQRLASWTKLEIIQQLFAEGFEGVVWIDADALFVNDEPDIRASFPPADIGLVAHHYNNRSVPNCGVMFLRNTAWCRAFLKRWSACPRHNRHFWWENAALLDLLGFTEFSAEGIFPRGLAFSAERACLRFFGRAPVLVQRWVRFVQRRRQRHFAEMDLRWNSLLKVGCAAQEPVIIHLAGLNFAKKRAWLSEHLQTL